MSVSRTARRTVAVVIAVAAAAVVAVVTVAAPASAAPEGAGRAAIVDCIPGLDGTNPPQSMAPSEVAGAFFDPASTRPPAAGSAAAAPAAGGAAPNTLASYGWAGFSWPDYDPGCATSLSMDDRLTGTLARASLATLVWANAATTGASRYAYDPATYDPVDQIAQSVDEGIGDGFARPGFWIVALLLGAALVWTADRRSPRHHAQVATIVLALGLSVVTVSTWNATLGPGVDKAVLTVVSWANAATTPGATGDGSDPGQQIGESLRTNIVLRTWQTGMFGPNEGTAKQYTDPLFAAGAISTAEAAEAGSDSDALGKLAEADKKAYEDIAGQVKDSDERAYDYLAGKHNGARLFYATLGWLTWLWAASFQTVAAFATAYALTLVRIVLGLWSAIALVALFRPRYALRAIGMLVGSLVAGIGLSVIAAGARLAYGELLSTASQANTWITVGIGLVVCAATWVIAWPLFRVLPGTPERMRRIGRKSRPADDATDGDQEPASAPGTVGRAGGSGGESGVPAEATTGRPAAPVLAAAAEGLPGRRAGAAPVIGRKPGGGAPGAGYGAPVDAAPATGTVTATAAETAPGGRVERTVVLPDTTAHAMARGTVNSTATSHGAAAVHGTTGEVTPSPGVGAEGRPSGRLTAYGTGRSPMPRPDPARTTAPRKVVPRTYPVFVPRRQEQVDPFQDGGGRSGR